MLFTRNERVALLFLSFILWLGMAVDALGKKYPAWQARLLPLTQDKLYLKTDVNRATAEELEQIPYIGPYTADRIIEYRQAAGCIRDLEELVDIPGIRTENYRIFSRYLFAREAACAP